jgi:hypothetical protein
MHASHLIAWKIYVFKPASVTVGGVFLLLLIWSCGTAWAFLLPRRSWVDGTRFARFASVVEFINPGEFRIKEAWAFI